MNDAPLLLAPRCILFDWHGTLVDTLDAMFAAMDEVLPQFEELGLVERLLEEADCLNADDVKLVRYIRIYRRLYPKILAGIHQTLLGICYSFNLGFFIT